MAGKDTAILSDLMRHLAVADEDPLTPLIDTYLIERSQSKHRLEVYSIPLIERVRPGGRISPSTIGGCKRQALFTFLGVEGIRRLDPQSELIFDDGNWAHHKWDARFYDMEKVLGKARFKVISIEKPSIIPEIYVAGSHDAIIKIDGKRYVVDFKTIRHDGFSYVYRTRKPKEAHVKQVVAYCVAHKIKRGLIIYDDKDSPDYMVYTIKVTQKEWNSVNRWCRAVIKHAEEETLPNKPADCEFGRFMYERCSYSGLCYGELSEAKLRVRAFRNFVDIDTAWKEGIRRAAA